MNRLAVFDCDGTLVDSQVNICVCVEHAFGRAELVVPSRDAIRRIVGLSLVEAMAALYPTGPDELHRMLAADYKAAFFALRTSGELDEEPLFDGIATVLQELADDGWMLGVATGKSDRGLAHILAQHDVAHHFVTLQTADRHPSKPHPAMLAAAIAEAGAAPETTAIIGDTSYDMMMAVNGGARAVGVTWGYHPHDELLEAGAHVVATEVAHLPRLLTA